MDIPTEITDAALRAQEAEPLTADGWLAILQATERFERRYNAVSEDDYPAERFLMADNGCYCPDCIQDYGTGR